LTRHNAYGNLGAVKQRSTTPVSKLSSATRACLVVLAILTLTLAPFAANQPVFADKFDDQIAALEKEISRYDKAADKLSNKADTLQKKLGQLTNQREKLQAQINKNQLKYDQLVAKIKAAEKKIQDNKDALGIILRDYAVDGDTSTLELLASSDNVAEFVDKQAYRESMQKTLVNTVNDIEKLKTQLEKDREAQKQVLNDMANQKKALQKKEAEQQQLIRETKGRESAFRQMMKEQNKQISELHAAQAAQNAQAAGGIGSVSSRGNCGGGYPGLASGANGNYGCNLPLDGGVDPWGMYNRECVSYTAFKVAQSGRNMPNWGNTGPANAIQWLDRAAADGISYDRNPRVGDVAILPVGYYGHSMYVEKVSGGQVYISEFNLNWDGKYTERWADASSMYYIHFK
jgi:peptidoglycan hydrolase CwlO-like protein/surface antigen